MSLFHHVLPALVCLLGLGLNKVEADAVINVNSGCVNIKYKIPIATPDKPGYEYHYSFNKDRVNPTRFKPKLDPGWDFTRICQGKDWHHQGEGALLVGGNEATIYTCFQREDTVIDIEKALYQNIRFGCLLDAKWSDKEKSIWFSNKSDQPRCITSGKEDGPIIYHQCTRSYTPTGDHLIDKQANPFKNYWVKMDCKPQPWPPSKQHGMWHYFNSWRDFSRLCDPNLARRPFRNKLDKPGQWFPDQTVEENDCPDKDGKKGKCPIVVDKNSHGDQYKDGGITHDVPNAGAQY